MFQVVLPHVTVQDLPSPSAWLDVVWSLVVLDRATTQHVASVLDPNFCTKLSVDTGMYRYCYCHVSDCLDGCDRSVNYQM
jgi:hypothetical protein